MQSYSCYKEKLYYIGQNVDSVEESEQNVITKVLNKNMAVGVISGFFSKGYPIYSISRFALKSIGHTYETFMEETDGDFLSLVHPDDEDIFRCSIENEQENQCDYRIRTREGSYIWVHQLAVRENTTERPKWYISIRFIDDIYKMNVLNNQMISSLNFLYMGIYQFHLDDKTVYCLQSQKNGAKGEIVAYEEWMDQMLSGHYIKEKDEESIRAFFDWEHLMEEYRKGPHSLQEEFRYRVSADVGWVSDTLIFGCDGGEKTILLLKKDVTKNHIYESALNSSVSAMKTMYQIYLEDNYYCMLYPDMKSVKNSGDYTKSIDMRIDEGRVHPLDKDHFHECLQIENLKKELKKSPYLECRYRRKEENKDVFEWCEASITVSERRDGVPVVATMIVRSIDEYVREQEKQKIFLKDAADIANSANRAKTEFLSRISHDIRTPMNAIVGTMAIAANYADDSEKVKECLKKIDTSSKHLLALINDILDMSKIESGKFSLQEEEFGLESLVSTTLDIIRPSVEEKNQTLSVHIQNVTHEDVIGDSMRIQNVLMNLLSNAVKYTPENGKIEVHLIEKQEENREIGCFEFVVKDTGIGISKEFKEHIFEPFSRENDERIHKEQGTGLGMAIARNIAHMMNGEIKVESELGKGSTFSVNFFLKLQPQKETLQNEFAGLSVLVVDDEPVDCKSICMTLKELGMNGVSVRSGREAVYEVVQAKREKRDFFAVLLDWKMPEMDGLQTAKAIREAVGKEVPVFIMSAYDWEMVEEKAKDITIDAFISKPLFKSKLLRVFHNLSENKTYPMDEIKIKKQEQKSFREKRILLVEDNEMNREIVREILEINQLSVDEVTNGKEALEQIERTKEGYYDMILMDIRMPVMDGYEAIEKLHHLERKDIENMPIIAMTANAFLEDIYAIKQAGFDAHIAKPIDIATLLQTLEEFL